MLPILYSFRRCPYAIRARLALHASGVATELREVSLRHKPASLLAASAKASVPVLVLPDGQIIDESWEIMLWALRQHDPENWLGDAEVRIETALPLVIENDSSFKQNLDCYKYPDQYPEHSPEHSSILCRSQAELFLQKLEIRLSQSPCLLGDTLSIADIAIFPFVRQFAGVDKRWFAQAPYPSLQNWLNVFLASTEFSAVMMKYPLWQAGEAPIIFHNDAVT